jgi:peptidoglycan/xylan/chitin deacetylase (PgdA/CDA1 family)
MPDLTRRILLSMLAIAAVVAIALPALTDLSWWMALLIFPPVHAALLWAQLSPHCTWLGPQIDRIPVFAIRRALWLTIDDGPDPVETPAVLDVLDRFGARATFFVIGSKAAAHPDLVREIGRRGHQVANHTATHPQFAFWTLPRRTLARELDHGADSIRAALPSGESLVPIFRSPVGMKPPALHPLLTERGWKLIGWSARGRDGVKNADVDVVVERLVAGAAPGAILVLHEGRGHAPALLQKLLPRIQAAGLTCEIPDADSLAGRR